MKNAGKEVANRKQKLEQYFKTKKLERLNAD